MPAQTEADVTDSKKDVAPEAGSRGFGVAALQLVLEPGDNLARIADEVAAIRRRLPWVRMVVLGELGIFGPDPALAQPLPGPAEQFLCEVARKNRLWLIPGSLFEQRDGAVFNTTPVIDPDGKVIARYRKMFPFFPYEAGVTPGSEFVVFDVPGAGRFGVSICYDMWFAETTRSLCSLGAEVILHPTMTYTIDRDVELAISRASAATNQCYFVDVNVAGRLGVGRSVICGPGGEVIHQAGSGRELMAFEVDFAHVRRVRERGWHNIGQTLKSFRDSKVVFPAYGAGVAHSTNLSALGPLALPRAD